MSIGDFVTLYPAKWAGGGCIAGWFPLWHGQYQDRHQKEAVGRIQPAYLDPMDLIKNYQEHRRELNAESDKVLEEITARLNEIETKLT